MYRSIPLTVSKKTLYFVAVVVVQIIWSNGICKNTYCHRFHGLRYVSRGKTNVRFGSIRFSLVESDNRLPNNFIVLRRRRCCHRTVYSNPNHFIALCRHRAQSFHYMLSQNTFILHIPFFERGDHVKLNQQMLRNAGPMDVVCTGAYL